MLFGWLRWTIVIRLISGIPLFVDMGFLADEPASLP